MEKIVIIGANDFQNPLILKAKEMGYETHVFAWQDGSVGERTADYFYPISIVEKEKILEKCKEIKPDAVATIASDLASITVNYLACKLNLPCNSERSVLISTNKYEMRKALKKAGIPSPEFHTVDEGYDISKLQDMKLPVIVKPTDRSGSRGITKLTSWEGLKSAIDDAIENSFEKKAIVEEYICGDEFSCECISYKGQHHFLTITKKFTTGAPHFIETGHIQPAGLESGQIKEIQHDVFNALDALEIENGASHSEFKVDADGNIRIIEIGARMGGDCIGSDLVQLSTGYDFLKMVIQVASGEEPDIVCRGITKVAIIQFIFSKDDYENYLDIQREHPDKIYHASDMKIKENSRIVDSSSRYGFYILACDSVEEAMELTRR